MSALPTSVAPGGSVHEYPVALATGFAVNIFASPSQAFAAPVTEVGAMSVDFNRVDMGEPMPQVFLAFTWMYPVFQLVSAETETTFVPCPDKMESPAGSVQL